MERNVLVVDDDAGDQILTEMALHSMGIQSERCFDPLMAIPKVEHGNYTDVLVDYKMPAMNGDELIYKLKQVNPHVNLYLSTGFHRDAFLNNPVCFL